MRCFYISFANLNEQRQIDGKQSGFVVFLEVFCIYQITFVDDMGELFAESIERGMGVVARRLNLDWAYFVAA